ncbi:hypothetical protein ES707_16150 [subsurface metagenome]
MAKRKRRTEENIEDVQRISDTLNRRIKKSNTKLGASGKDKKNKNSFLSSNGGIDLIETFPKYKNKRKRKDKRR